MTEETPLAPARADGAPGNARPAIWDVQEQMNRTYSGCNALYHEVSVCFGLSDTALWVLYALRTGGAQTQNRISADWALPKQTLNSAVSAMVRQGLLYREPTPGRSGKLLHLTAAGHALADRTVEPLMRAEQASLERFGRDNARLLAKLEQDHLAAMREEFRASILSPDAPEGAAAHGTP